MAEKKIKRVPVTSLDDVDTIPGVGVTDFADELTFNFLAYAKHVIQDRAIPDVHDGLKPVHRRILWAMYDMGCRSGSKPKKCAEVCGSVTGKYHPHGEVAVYNALVRMAQSWSMSVPLIEGQGNFGNADGHPPAAQRYTESRLSKFGEHVLFSDIQDEVVDFVDNYSGEYQEPSVLPARIPLVLLTAPSGIAVGMATTILPFNLGEVCDSLIALIDDASMDSIALSNLLPAPDFPLGGLVKEGSREELYDQGRAAVRFRCSADFETEGKRRSIIIRDIPFAKDKSALVEEIAKVAEEEKVNGIADYTDESTKEGIRINVILKPDVDPQVVLNQLYTHTSMESNMSMNTVAICNRKPVEMGVLSILKEFIDFRRTIVRKRTESRKRNAEAKLEIVQGVLLATKNADAVLEIVRKSSNPIRGLMKDFGLSQRQAEYIFNMPVRKFSQEDTDKQKKEEDELTTYVAELGLILSDKKHIDAIIKEETQEIKEKFAVPRKTTLISDFGSLTVKDCIKEEEVVLAFLSNGTIKSTPVSDYRIQRRRGQGMMGMPLPDGIYPLFVTQQSSHAELMLLTDKGNRYKLRVYDIPVLDRVRTPRHISSYIPVFKDDERVIAATKSHLEENEVLVILGSKGQLVKQIAKTVNSVRDSTTKFFSTEIAGNVVGALVAHKNDEIVISTAKGQALRTKLSKIREVKKRAGAGVRAIRIQAGDNIIGLSVVVPNGVLMTVSKDGYGKRSNADDLPVIGRGGKGVIICDLKDDDALVFAEVVEKGDGDEGLFIMTNLNKAIRMKIGSVRLQVGRRGLGVHLKKMDDGEVVTAVSVE